MSYLDGSTAGPVGVYEGGVTEHRVFAILDDPKTSDIEVWISEFGSHLFDVTYCIEPITRPTSRSR